MKKFIKSAGLNIAYSIALAVFLVCLIPAVIALLAMGVVDMIEQDTRPDYPFVAKQFHKIAKLF